MDKIIDGQVEVEHDWRKSQTGLCKTNTAQEMKCGSYYELKRKYEKRKEWRDTSERVEKEEDEYQLQRLKNN